VTITARAAARLRAGHVWVYKSDISKVEQSGPGALVSVRDERGRGLGTALYSNSSQIAVRMISRDAVIADELRELIAGRVAAAIDYRKQVVRNSDAFRVVFSEADFLPGLIVDKYNDVLAVQVLTQAMDAPDLRDAVVAELVREFQPAGIIERVDARIRELEQLPPREGGQLHGDKPSTTFSMNGVRFRYEGLGGQKTGAFLDQRENYAAAERYAHGRALDVFTYQGGFALHLARVCDEVVGVDASREALEIAEQNAKLNGRDLDWLEANAFDLLKDYSEAGEQYDTIVLDPPAFAKSKRAAEGAVRGYKELNLRALKMLKPGGILVSCSCSHHVSEAEFQETVTGAAADARRSVRILEKRVQAQDHPILAGVPETFYLKCLICKVR
jgi:23S rRNA (cytosine1962-C5)-methyltransferase